MSALSKRAKDAACRVTEIIALHPVLGPAWSELNPLPPHTRPGIMVTDHTPAANDLANAIARAIDREIAAAVGSVRAGLTGEEMHARLVKLTHSEQHADVLLSLIREVADAG